MSLASLRLALGGGSKTLLEVGRWRLDSRPDESLTFFTAAEEIAGDGEFVLRAKLHTWQARALLRMGQEEDARHQMDEAWQLRARDVDDDSILFSFSSVDWSVFNQAEQELADAGWPKDQPQDGK